MDNQIISLPLPTELDNPFFFPTKIIKVEKNTSMLLTENFIYDALFYNGITSFKPWQNQADAFPHLIEEWEKVREQLEELHRNRDQKNTLNAMKKGIGLFLQLLFWSNDRPVMIKEPISFYPLDCKPVNIEERLAFIISRPNLFHSFRQLSELMVEQEKAFVKKSIRTKAKSPWSAT
jgi:hypothetical protein